MVRRARWLGAFALASLLTLSFSTQPARAAGVTIVVNNTSDQEHTCRFSGVGICSLRDAIIFANSNAGADTIAFAIDGNGPHTIFIYQPLPPLTDNAGTTIDGYTQLLSSANVLDMGSSAIVRVEIDGAFSPPQSPAFQLFSSNNLIKGLSITNFAGGAIVVSGNHNAIEGNFIGIDPVDHAGPNGSGIQVLTGSTFNTIGGPAAEQRNVIGANTGSGISVHGPNTGNTLVQNNIIGADRTTLGSRPNGGWGVFVNGAVDTLVSRNVIAFNIFGGVGIQGAGAMRNVVTENQTFQNNGLGVDLGTFGVTPNDTLDTDSGPNFLQNAPVLTAAYKSASQNRMIVFGSMDSSVFAGTVDIEFYWADVAGPGPGEGRFPLYRAVTAGYADFDFAIGPFSPAEFESPSNFLTALATSTDGTSEFSANIPITFNAMPTASAGTDSTAAVGDLVQLDGHESSDKDQLPGPLTYAWTQIGGPSVVLQGADTALPTFVPQQGGTYEFKLVVSDGLDESAVDTVTVSVGDKNPPTASGQTITVKPGTPRTIRLIGSDAEPSNLTYKVLTLPEFGTLSGFNEDTGVAIYTAPAGFSGTDSFTFTVSDGVSTSAPATVAIVVGDGLGIVTGSATRGVMGETYRYQLAAAGGAGPYAWSTDQAKLPPGLRLTSAGVIDGTPHATGQFTFTVTVTDSKGVKASRSIALTVGASGNHPFKLFIILPSSD